MRNVSFHQEAFEQLSDLAKTDKKLFERLHRLIIETARNPFDGIGKPESLKADLKGFIGRAASATNIALFIKLPTNK